jgi:RNA polymerase sigma factor (sigma-70 family)
MFVHSTLTLSDRETASCIDDHRDRELMTGVQARDVGAFEMLYSTFYHRLSRFIFQVTRQLDMVEDVINETMLVVWEKPETFDYTCKVSTWIFGIAYRKALKTSAKQARSAHAVPIDEFGEELADNRASPARQVEGEDLLSVALNSLPQEQRAVIELTFGHGLRYQEIAAILDCPENTVKTRMFHARKRLQTLFDELPPKLMDPSEEDMS